MKFGARDLWVTLVLLLSSTDKYVNIGNQIQRRLANKVKPYNEKSIGVVLPPLSSVRYVR